MVEANVVAELIVGDADRIAAFFAVAGSLSSVLSLLATKLVDRLEEEPGFADRWTAAPGVDGSKSSGVTLAAKDGPVLAYALFDAGGFRPWVGLIATPEQEAAFDLSALKLRRDGRWARWEYLDAGTGFVDAYIGVLDGSLPARLMAHADDLAVRLRRVENGIRAADISPGMG